MSQGKRPTVLYLFPFPIESVLEEVGQGEAPTERLYGAWELRERGWSVGFEDGRHRGRFGKLVARLNRFVRLMDFATLRAIVRHDIVVVKDEFSILITLLARVSGTKVVYFDSMFRIPRRFWRRWSAVLNVRWAHAVLAYSRSQVELWEKLLPIPKQKIDVLTYGMDESFYAPVEWKPGDYVLAVGRDPGRDFGTLVRALDGSGVKLKLITLPYLLPAGTEDRPDVERFERVSYEELFNLYAGALASIVPLRAGLSHPSGIRAVYESNLLGVPTICTRTKVIEEDYTHDHDIWFVEPEDVDGLRDALRLAATDPERFQRLADRARGTVLAMSVARQAAQLEEVLHRL